MAITAWVVERFVLGPLVNQDGLTLFMSTIGVTFMIEGGAQMLFGGRLSAASCSDRRLVPVREPFPGGILVNKLDVWGGADRRRCWWSASRCSSSAPRPAARCARVADDHAAAQSVGIPLNWIWFIVWLVAGLVALGRRAPCGAPSSACSSPSPFLALKALPVLIIGGFTSVPGAIVGGLIVGAGEKLAEGYLGPLIGGGIEYWFAYVLALVVLLVRPQGLFGERIIERLWACKNGI